MRYVPATLAAFGAGLAVCPAFAATEEPLDQIIVTASRAPLSISATGSAVTVFTRDDIERRQARYVADLLRLVPGFAVSQSGAAGSQTQIRVRGAEANHVLVLIDGARANDPATGDEFRWEFLTTADIERIEIVRGPHSATWGSDALAGVVNIITRSGSGHSALDGYVETGANGTLNDAVHGNLHAGEWDLGLSVERLSTEGTNISRTGVERDDSSATTAALSASWKAGDAVALRLSARSVAAYSQYDIVDYVTTGLPADSDVALDTDQKYAQLAAVIGGQNARMRHRIAARYVDTANRNLVDGGSDVSSSSDRLTLSYQADIRLASDTLSVAVERETTAFRQRGPIDFGNPNQDRDMDVTSGVFEYQGHPTGRFSWLASARYDDSSIFGDALTGRLSASWSVTDRTRLRAGLGTGRKNPTFIELYGFYPGQFLNNPGLQPEESTGIELGIEQQFRDSLMLQVALFRQDLENEIDGFVFDPVTYLSTAANLDGRSRRNGGEVAVRWDAGESLTVHANYTYLDATADHVREVRRPRHSGSIDIDQAVFAGRGRLVLAASYGGTRSDTFFPPWPDAPRVVVLHSHWLVDLTTRYSLSPRVDLFVRVTNLLDTDYEEVYGYNTPGRAAYAGFRLTLGR